MSTILSTLFVLQNLVRHTVKLQKLLGKTIGEAVKIVICGGPCNTSGVGNCPSSAAVVGASDTITNILNGKSLELVAA